MTSPESQMDISSEFRSFKVDMLNCLQNIHRLLDQRGQEAPEKRAGSINKRKSSEISGDFSLSQDNDANDSDPIKSQALIYYEEEEARNKKWKSIECDDFSIDITDGERYRSLFEGFLPDFYAFMHLFSDNRQHVMGVKDYANFQNLEAKIYLPKLEPKQVNEPKRKPRPVTKERRLWIEFLKAVCYPFFNENRPKTTCCNRLGYSDRVYVIAQWIRTFIFYDMSKILYSITGPSGMVTKEHKLKLKLGVIIRDIKGLQKNRTDTDTKHIDKLICTDESRNIEVPEVVLSARKRRRSPSKKDQGDDEEMMMSHESNGSSVGVEEEDFEGYVDSRSSSSSSSSSLTKVSKPKTPVKTITAPITNSKMTTPPTTAAFAPRFQVLQERRPLGGGKVNVSTGISSASKSGAAPNHQSPESVTSAAVFDN